MSSQPTNKRQDSQAVYFSLMSFFGPKPEAKTPIKGWGIRVKNLFTHHFRGIIGMLVPVCALTWQGDKSRPHITVQCMWMWMFWFFLFQPVAVPVTGLIPLFILPMAGVVDTLTTAGCYTNEFISLFILSNMLLLLLNNSGVDRRFALSLICSGDNCQFSGKRLVFKCGVSAFFLSMFSNRLIVTSSIMQYVTPALTDLQASTAQNRANEPNFNEMRFILNQAIQTSSAIGSIGIMHSSYTSLCFRALFGSSAPAGKTYPDIFNYMQYSAYAFPVAFIMFIINLAYHMILINKCVGKAMSANSMTALRTALLKHKAALPRRVTLHEKLTVFFMILSLIIFFTRWSTFLNMGWAEFSRDAASPQLPGVSDATVAAIFVIILHILPNGYRWLTFLTVDKKSELGNLKPESGILWWRFVDKNLNYGYIYLIGGGGALLHAVKSTHLDQQIVDHFGRVFTNHAFNTSLFLVCLVTVILANMMSGVATIVIFLPLILSMAAPPEEAVVFRSIKDWPLKMYLGALGVGLGSSMGYMSPFLYSPAYYSHYTGNVPKKRMAKYGLGSVIICFIILWLSLVYYAPVIWDPTGAGILPVPAAGGAAASNGTNTSGII